MAHSHAICLYQCTIGNVPVRRNSSRFCENITSNMIPATCANAASPQPSLTGLWVDHDLVTQR